MSTRCHIAFYENRAQDFDSPTTLLYRHSDGYPDGPHGVLATLLPMLRTFQERRGLDDIEYAAAWVLWSQINAHVEWVKGFAAEMGTDNTSTPMDGIDCLGYGICSGHGFHGDHEYIYAVYPDGLDVHDRSGVIQSFPL